MARPPSPGLTDAELRVMRVLWEFQRATVGEVVARLASTHSPAYNTVLTILGILERKGYVTHEKDGRAFAYLPVVDQSEARQSALSQVLKRFFDDSPRLLVLDLLGHERTDADELRRVRELIENTPQDSRGATRAKGEADDDPHRELAVAGARNRVDHRSGGSSHAAAQRCDTSRYLVARTRRGPGNPDRSRARSNNSGYGTRAHPDRTPSMPPAR